MPNVFDYDWDFEQEQPGFRWKRMRIGLQLGAEKLGRGDTALFPTGPNGAHQLVNRSDQVARCMIVSTMLEPEIVEYPESGKVGLMAGAPPGKGDQGALKVYLRRDAEVGYFEDEPADSR